MSLWNSTEANFLQTQEYLVLQRQNEMKSPNSFNFASFQASVRFPDGSESSGRCGGQKQIPFKKARVGLGRWFSC